MVSEVAMRRSVVVLTVSLIFLCPVTSASQSTPTKIGKRVRATYTDPSPGKSGTNSVVGTVIDVDTTSVTLKTSSSDSLLVLEKQNMEMVEVSTARSRKGRGALKGAGIGAVTGAVVGLLSGDDESGMVRATAGEKAAILAVSFAVIGAVLGAIGAPGEQWETVYLKHEDYGFGRELQKEAGIFLSFRF